VRQEGLGKLNKKFNDLIGNQTPDLPACSIAPQPLRYHVPPHLEQCLNNIQIRNALSSLYNEAIRKLRRFSSTATCVLGMNHNSMGSIHF
jgi:hypothetical protein